MKIKPLSPLEQEVMNIVWGFKQCTVRDVLGKLKRKHLAYTTVSTILTRLYEKGMLAKRGEDTAIIYKPKIEKKDYGKSVAGSFFAKFFHSFGDAAITSFAESIEKLPKEKKDYFLKLLEKRHEN